MAKWVILKVTGVEETELGTFPGNYSQKEICEILRRLVCTTLTETEIISASHRRKKGVFSDVRLQQVGSGFPLVFGHTETHFLAKWEPS